MTLSPNPRRALAAGSISLAVCIGVIMLGALAAAAPFPPGARVPLASALAAAVQTSPIAAFQAKGGLIVLVVVPVMIAMWLAYIANRHDRTARRRTLTLAWPALLIAALCIGQIMPCFFSPIVCVTLPVGMLVWHTDAETYTEALICWVPVGWWIWTMLAISWLDSRRQRPAHLCPSCNYDRTGLDPAARCPECGQTRLTASLRSIRQ